ncbi:EcsC family protein [Alkalihalobacillus oceani]|uniref:EcsC family protein n=1 Tax=Halalkalibacter oceani TaxID=1653776 RepID=UPI0020400B85|nr:EcsC family protein [Halalkalibacter oceani]MCM3759648.1 EcsC family protein [Halalkalibacter oceani]
MTDGQLEMRWQEIKDWEETYFSAESSDFAKSYHKWTELLINQLGEKRKQKWLTKVDDCLFHLQAWSQHSRSHEENRRRIIQYARIFDATVSSIADLQQLSLEQLDYLAEQLMAKQRLLALGQGGLTGMGGIFLLSVDLPAMALIQLRSLQQLAEVYGFDSRKPVEMVYLLKLLYVATLPKSYQKAEWDKLLTEVGEQADDVFYQGDDSIFQKKWLDQLLAQVAKSFMIAMLRKKTVQGVPLVGMAVGAGLNYRFTQQVIEVGQRFYQIRRLLQQ